jgi:hypothetical protein
VIRVSWGQAGDIEASLSRPRSSSSRSAYNNSEKLIHDLCGLVVEYDQSRIEGLGVDQLQASLRIADIGKFSAVITSGVLEVDEAWTRSVGQVRSRSPTSPTLASRVVATPPSLA